MAWNDNPQVRELVDYMKRHSFKRGVFIGINDSDFAVVTGGIDKKLCDSAKKIGDRIYSEIASGEIEV